MFKKAPDVEVFAPSILFAGRDATVEIVVTSKDALKVEYIEATFVGYQGWRVSSGKTTVSNRAELPRLVARLQDEGELPAGESRFRATFRLPAEVPPSHELGHTAWAFLGLHVRVAIPWWPDGRYKFTLPVRKPPPPSVERTPFALRSTAAAGQPRLELSLASTALIAGETVVGSVAVYHLDDTKPRDVDITLVPTYTLKGRRLERERRGETLHVTVTIPTGGAGTSVPFRFTLPADITPTFTAITHDLAWWLVARSGSFFGGKVDVAVPLRIFDASAAATTGRLTSTPRLTDKRVTDAFAQLASEHGWQATVDADDPDQLVYQREVGDAMLRLGYSYRGEDGAFLVASIAYPRLGLALHVTPSNRVRELFSKDIEVDIADWDRAHHVTARSATQSLSFLHAAVPHVIEATKRLRSTLHVWTDDELVLERPVATLDIHELTFADELLTALAHALVAVPVLSPPELQVDLPAYRQLAQRLQGRLAVGDLTIEGTLDQRPVLVALEFDGERPVALVARVGDPDTAVEDTLALAGRLDVERVRELVTRLRAELAAREPAGGPYR